MNVSSFHNPNYFIDPFGDPTFSHEMTLGPGILFYEKVPSSVIGIGTRLKEDEICEWVCDKIEYQILFCLKHPSTETGYKTCFLYNKSKQVREKDVKTCQVTIKMFKFGEPINPENIENIIFQKSSIKTDMFYLEDLKKIVTSFGRVSVINKCGIGMCLLANLGVGDANRSNKYLSVYKDLIK